MGPGSSSSCWLPFARGGWRTSGAFVRIRPGGARRLPHQDTERRDHLPRLHADHGHWEFFKPLVVGSDLGGLLRIWTGLLGLGAFSGPVREVLGCFHVFPPSQVVCVEC